MGNRNNQLFFAALIVVVPALVHALYRGSYILGSEADPRTFWIGPISTTIPFVILALTFLAHARTAAFARSAWLGAALAWLAMMTLTLYLTSQPGGPEQTSTMAIAVILTPLFYLPIGFVGYLAGAIVGRFAGRGSPAVAAR